MDAQRGGIQSGEINVADWPPDQTPAWERRWVANLPSITLRYLKLGRSWAAWALLPQENKSFVF